METNTNMFKAGDIIRCTDDFGHGRTAVVLSSYEEGLIDIRWADGAEQKAADDVYFELAS